MKLELRYLLIAGLFSSAVQAAEQTDASLIAQGEYLARAGDCTACHTVAGGKEFGGGLAIASPMGIIYSTNISPDPKAGIGQYSEQDFADAVRKGVRRALLQSLIFPKNGRPQPQFLVCDPRLTHKMCQGNILQ